MIANVSIGSAIIYVRTTIFIENVKCRLIEFVYPLFESYILSSFFVWITWVVDVVGVDSVSNVMQIGSTGYWWYAKSQLPSATSSRATLSPPSPPLSLSPLLFCCFASTWRFARLFISSVCKLQLVPQVERVEPAGAALLGRQRVLMTPPRGLISSAYWLVRHNVLVPSSRILLTHFPHFSLFVSVCRNFLSFWNFEIHFCGGLSPFVCAFSNRHWHSRGSIFANDCLCNSTAF